MARKKIDFKPDKRNPGGAGKLFLTKKQRQTLLKWLLHSTVLLVLLVVQDVIMSQVHLFGATTDLFCAGLLLVIVLEGAESGGVFALAASVIYLFSGSAPGPYSVALLPILGVTAAVFRQAYLRKSFLANWICAAVALVVYEMAVFGIALFLQLTHLGRTGIFFTSALLSVAVMPLLYPLFTSIGKIGGETWKE